MACKEIGITIRTLQRWQQGGVIKGDGRPDATRPLPANKLSEEERATVLKVSNSPEYGSLPPGQIVPSLADQGIYLASESTFYRIMHENGQQNHRGRASKPGPAKDPSSHCANAPNEVWCWDISWLPGPVKGHFYYLYMIIDIYSRKIVAQEVHDEETSEYAAQLVQKAVLSEGCAGTPLVLHSDNGSPMKGSTLLDKLYKLGISSSYNRPRVSNDNAYAESIFRTCKYRPAYPTGGFVDINAARLWILDFTRWYNNEHRHSAIRYVTPAQRHRGEDTEILANRKEVYEKARKKHPNRWARNTRNWSPVSEVWLNPEKVDSNEPISIALGS